MTKASDSAWDEDLERGKQRMKELLAMKPAEFERWANETLDMSKARQRKRTG